MVMKAADFDLNNADEQRSFELIPAGTVVTVVTKLRPGQSGPDGWLKDNKTGNAQMLDFELTVMGGPYDKRKMWTLMIISGETEGQSKAAEITRSTLRAMLESARGVSPKDNSDTAKAARRLTGWADLDGLNCIIRVGIERGTNGYKDKNIIDAVIVPTDKAWYRPDGPAPNGASIDGASATVVPLPGKATPAWAR